MACVLIDVFLDCSQSSIFPLELRDIECFHMTSDGHIGDPKQCNGGHVGVPNKPVGVEVFSYANAFLYSNKFAKIMAT